MAGSSSDAPSPPTIAQKMMIGGQALGERHRQGADRVAEQAQHVGPLAPDEVADLAADQDERGRDQRLERDRRLDAADRRVEVLDHRRDRDVHQRRVDDEHEHRHRQQDGEPWIARRLRGRAGAGLRHRGRLRRPLGRGRLQARETECGHLGRSIGTRSSRAARRPPEAAIRDPVRARPIPLRCGPARRPAPPANSAASRARARSYGGAQFAPGSRGWRARSSMSARLTVRAMCPALPAARAITSTCSRKLRSHASPVSRVSRRTAASSSGAQAGGHEVGLAAPGPLERVVEPGDGAREGRHGGGDPPDVIEEHPAARLDLTPVGALGELPGAHGAGTLGLGPADLGDGHLVPLVGSASDGGHDAVVHIDATSSRWGEPGVARSRGLTGAPPFVPSGRWRRGFGLIGSRPCHRPWCETPSSTRSTRGCGSSELSAATSAGVDLASVPDARVGRDRRARVRRRLADGRLGAQPGRHRDRARATRTSSRAFGRALPDYRPEDVVGSPYCIRDYVVDGRLGGPDGLAAARAALAERGLGLILDFVPNHVAPDHPWTADASRALRPGHRRRPRARPGVVRRGRRPGARQRPRPVLPGLARRRAARTPSRRRCAAAVVETLRRSPTSATASAATWRC